MADHLNVAVAQCPADLDGSQARLRWLADRLDAQKGQAMDLVVLPELFQSGYNIGDLLGQRAEASDGPFFSAIADLAKVHGVAILYGFAERQGGTLYNSAQCIDKHGVIIGHHRKLLLPPGFEGDHFAPGGESPLFEVGGFRIAILVCYDVEFPENVRHAALRGADLVVVPTALGAQWGVVANKVVPSRAFENGVFVCYANYCGTENGVTFYGGSCIVGPDGRDVLRAGDASAFPVASLDRAAVQSAQKRLPYLRDLTRLPAR